MHLSNRLLIVSGFLATMFFGCSDKTLNQDAAKVDVAFKIVADAKSDFAAVASTAEVKISAEGMPTLTQPLTVTSSGISGTIAGIVAGPNRKFEVFVYDAANKLCYYGSAVGEVTVGGTANIAMTLYRTNGEGNAVINGTIQSTNTPPTVSLTSPANDAQFTLGTAISLAATATDADGSVSSVAFYNGSTLLFTDNAAPYSYSVTPSAAGSYSLKAVATDNAGSSTTSAIVSVTVIVVNQTSYKINCGGSAVSPFAADGYYSGGSTSSTTSAITITGITNPAPAGVYKVERYGNVTYTFPSLVSGASYNVRLHFAEIYFTASAKRRFNVAINGSQVLSNFDIYATAGAAKKAVLREFTATANSSSQIIIKLTNVTDNASICGIEIIPATTPPVISVQPANTSTCSGTNATVSVTATGATGYQWYSGAVGSGTAISGATSSSYSTQTAGSYYCVVTGAGGSVTSSVATITINASPVISVQPANTSTCSGTNATLSVTATGATGYQWYRGAVGSGTAISGATTSTYSTQTASTYYCILISSSGCSVTSNAASVTVNPIPSAGTLSFSPSSVCAGSIVILTNSNSAGTSYSWYKGSTLIRTSTTNTISWSAQSTDVGSYTCIVSNGSCASAQTAAVSLSINSILIASSPSSVTVPCPRTNQTFSVVASGSSGYTYQWQWNTNGGTTYSNCPEGAYFAGTRTATLTTTPDQSKWLRCVVTDGCGVSVTSGTAVMSLRMLSVVPPADVYLSCGTSSTQYFSVTASGTDGYTYQWEVSTDGSNFSNCPEGRYYTGTTTRTLTTTPDQNKYLRCVVSDNCGNTVTSNAAYLYIYPCP